MKKSAVIITKPLQYINASNIYNEKRKDLFVVSWFVNYEWFVETIARTDSTWDTVHVFTTRNQALRYILKHKKAYDDIFVDTDFGIGISLLFFLLMPVNINVYEEGWATYHYINPKMSAMKTWKWLLCRLFFHYNNYIGGGYFTRSIYVYDPNKYLSNINNSRQEIISFSKGFYDHILDMKDFCNIYSKRLVTDTFKDANVILFLGSWPETHYDYFTGILNENPGYKSIIKNHPHYVQDNQVNNFHTDLVVDADIPAEIVIIQLLRIVKHLVVVHEHSSALMYIKSDKIADIDYYKEPM